MKKILCMVVLLTALCLLVGCNDDTPTSENPTTGGQTETSIPGGNDTDYKASETVAEAQTKAEAETTAEAETDGQDTETAVTDSEETLAGVTDEEDTHADETEGEAETLPEVKDEDETRPDVKDEEETDQSDVGNQETKTYTVIFHSCGGSAVQSQTVKHGELATEPHKPT